MLFRYDLNGKYLFDFTITFPSMPPVDFIMVDRDGRAEFSTTRERDTYVFIRDLASHGLCPQSLEEPGGLEAVDFSVSLEPNACEGLREWRDAYAEAYGYTKEAANLIIRDLEWRLNHILLRHWRKGGNFESPFYWLHWLATDAHDVIFEAFSNASWRLEDYLEFNPQTGLTGLKLKALPTPAAA